MGKQGSAAARAAVPGSGSGTAGRQGDDVRSDLWVSVELRTDGGIEFDLTSRVEAYYGESLREQTLARLESFGVRHATVRMRDQGALPYVIDARIDAALRAAGVNGPGAKSCAPAIAPPAPSDKRRLRRSRLYLPGNEPRYFINAGLHGPDGVILDLEDSVHADHKPAARLLVRNALHAVDFHGAERMVRINPLPMAHEDLEAIVPERPEMLLIPKVETADQVREIDDAVSRLQSGGDATILLMPILESALGIENAFEIASASKRIAALTIGLEDYAADLGVPKSADGRESLYARTRVVNAARAAGLQAIDSVYGQVDDLDGLRAWCEQSRRLGFCGMGCLHPRQVEVIHTAYNPTAKEIDRALKIVEAFEQARAAGLGVVSLGSKMIDPPVIKQAGRLVDQARALGLIVSPQGDRS